MSILCPDQIAESLTKRPFLPIGAKPFNYLNLEGLTLLTLDIKPSNRGRVKVFFNATSYVVVNVLELQQGQPNPDSFYEDPSIPINERIAIALTASVIEGLKDDIFPGIKIGKTIESLKLTDQNIVFTTFRLQTNKKGEERYNILVLRRTSQIGRYEQDEMITLSVLRQNETIEIELGSTGSKRHDTIAFRAILNAVLGKLKEQDYIIYEPDESHGRPGKWVFDNFRPTD